MEAIPAVLEIGLSLNSVQTELPIPIDDNLRGAIAQIDWDNDFRVLASMVKLIADIEDINELMNNPTSVLSRENEGFICGIIKKLSELTFVTKLIPTALEIAFNSEEVKELIGEVTVDLSNIIWNEEIANVAEIYSAFQLLAKDVSKTLFTQEITSNEKIAGINLNALNQMILKIFELRYFCISLILSTKKLFLQK
jgi:hypothetical protein